MYIQSCFWSFYYYSFIYYSRLLGGGGNLQVQLYLSLNLLISGGVGFLLVYLCEPKNLYLVPLSCCLLVIKA